MPTASKIIAKAESFLGVSESPANSNNVQFNTDYYGHAVSGDAYPWCCTFVWDIFRMCGASELFYGGEKTAYCPTAQAWYANHGYKVDRSSRAQKGDVVFFANRGTICHIGFVVSDDGTTVTTIEGNTSAGNNANGGQVQKRFRTRGTVGTSWYIHSFARPLYENEEDDELNSEQANYLKTIYTQVTKKTDPTGRDVKMNDHDHIKWIGKVQSETLAAVNALTEEVKALRLEVEELKKQ